MAKGGSYTPFIKSVCAISKGRQLICSSSEGQDCAIFVSCTKRAYIRRIHRNRFTQSSICYQWMPPRTLSRSQRAQHQACARSIVRWYLRCLLNWFQAKRRTLGRNRVYQPMHKHRIAGPHPTSCDRFEPNDFPTAIYL